MLELDDKDMSEVIPMANITNKQHLEEHTELWIGEKLFLQFGYVSDTDERLAFTHLHSF